MLFDFMQQIRGQITSRLESLERKVDGNQQVLEKLLKKVDKRKASITTFYCFIIFMQT